MWVILWIYSSLWTTWPFWVNSQPDSMDTVLITSCESHRCVWGIIMWLAFNVFIFVFYRCNVNMKCVSNCYWWRIIDVCYLIMSLISAAGFYICWGCLVWVPSIYTSPGMYLVNHPVHLGAPVSMAILLSPSYLLFCLYFKIWRWRKLISELCERVLIFFLFQSNQGKG